MRIIGPNCMGLYYPKEGLSFCADFPLEPDTIGWICQSGGNTTYLIRLAEERGLRFSKGVSFGNACDINECDLLEYLAGDPETKVIAAYIEGTRDGARLLETLTAAASAKPVVVFKGGYTEGGRRAAASHTSALAGSDVVWDGLLTQAGAIRVYSVEEMVDMLVALVRLRPPRGPNVCAVGNGGGSSVLTTDECEHAGLRMLSIPAEIRDRLKAFIPLAGSMLRNPIDGGFLIPLHPEGMFAGRLVPSWEEAVKGVAVMPGDGGWGDFLRILEDWREIDLVLFHFSVDINPIAINEWNVGTAVGPIIAAARRCRLPAAMVLHFVARESSWRSSLRVQQMCLEAGLPLFLSMRGAARAIRRLIDFNKAHPGMLDKAHSLHLSK
jgi:hypothetical protein